MTVPLLYLGTHRPAWLWNPAAAMPLCVSRRTLGMTNADSLRPALCSWMLDSGGFTELSMHGQWELRPDVYVGMVADFDRIIGSLDWAAPQDWMCEPPILARTGLTVDEHQARTVENFLTLVKLWPEYSDADCPFMPVLQGWTLTDYEACAGRYAAAGIALDEYPVVGLGSVCRRQDTAEIGTIVQAFTPWLALHGFGVKTAGLTGYGHCLTSADSMAWSLRARMSDPLPGCTHSSCANCLRYAAAWHGRLTADVEAALAAGVQLDLFKPPPPDCWRCGGPCREPGA